MPKRNTSVAALIVMMTLVAGCATMRPTATPAVPTISPTGMSAEATSLVPSTPTLVTVGGATPTPSRSTEVGPGAGLTISLVYDNTAYDPELRAEWGFAAFLEYGEHRLLFDTGGDSRTLLANMDRMGLDPQEIEAVVLSHAHQDHTGGLEGLLDTGVQPTVYVPASFPGSFKDSVRARTQLVEVSEPLEILPGVHTTGELGAAVREQALVLGTTAGNVVVTGCAHPGIVRMVRAAQELVGGEIALVIGGFHLGDAGQERIRGIIADFRDMGVRQVSPTHCTGDRAIAMFADEYGDDYVQGGVGRVIVSGPAPSPARERPVATGERSAPWPTRGWPASTPEEQGMDSEMLAGMLDSILSEDYAIDSVTIIRHGFLVADATVYPFSPETEHAIHSCTKSIVSALIGIALEQGYITSVEQPVLSFFPEAEVKHLPGKQAMTLEHLLTMTTGLECRDSYLYRWRGLMQMKQSDDWVAFMLDLPLVEDPGARFEYCNGASFLLSAIIQETTGRSALEFAQEHLFGPLGITDVHWPSNPQSVSIGWGELRMRPHDMAKIGYLYLREGQWDGQQLIPAEWVAASTRKHVSATLADGYGYQWWVDEPGKRYMALGYAGQFIYVVPKQDLVVVFTSNLEEKDFYVPQELLTALIIPAAMPVPSLPNNSAGLALLQASAQALSQP